MTEQERIDAHWEPLRKSPFADLWRDPDGRLWEVMPDGSALAVDTTPGLPEIAFRLRALEKAVALLEKGSAQEKRRIANKLEEFLQDEREGHSYRIAPRR